MRTNIQKMIPATVCNICREEINVEETHDATSESDWIGFNKDGGHYDFHKACLADYQFKDPRAVEDGSKHD